MLLSTIYPLMSLSDKHLSCRAPPRVSAAKQELEMLECSDVALNVVQPYCTNLAAIGVTRTSAVGDNRDI
jgi:hypothetical protein